MNDTTQQLLMEIIARLTRIETRLVRLMQVHALNEQGDTNQ